MSIAITCRNCQEAFKVKDELAGKKVVCRICKNPILVPTPVAAPSPPSAEVEDLAVSTLVEEPAAAEAAPADTFEAECPSCAEVVTWSADKAGKQSPCPNCRRVVRVPMPTDGRVKDWRAADHRPQGVKEQIDKGMEGTWGSPGDRKWVDRESLKEAGVLADRKRPPWTTGQKVKAAIYALGLVAIILVAGWKFLRNRTEGQRDASLQQALELMSRQKATLPPAARAAVQCDVAAYRLRQSEPKPDEALTLLKEARAAATEGDATPDQAVERAYQLAEVAFILSDLAGTKEQIRNGERLTWSVVQPELRRTFQQLTADRSQIEGAILTLQRLTRKLRLEGDSGYPSVQVLASGDAFPPEDRADALAAVALEWLGLDEAEQKKAAEQAPQLKSLVGGSTPPARVVALFVALKQTQAVASVRDPSAGGDVSQAARRGFAEGHARLGDFGKARQIALLPGRFEERFRAMVDVAAVGLQANGDAQDLLTAVDMLKEARDLPDWSLIRLARLCAEAKQDEAGKRLNDVLQKLSGPLSPRAQSVRALAQLELLRSPTAVVSEAEVKAITPATSLGHLLAWELLARRTRPANVDAWPEPARPLGLAGTALGLQDKSR